MGASNPLRKPLELSSLLILYLWLRYDKDASDFDQGNLESRRPYKFRNPQSSQARCCKRSFDQHRYVFCASGSFNTDTRPLSGMQVLFPVGDTKRCCVAAFPLPFSDDLG